MYYSICFLVAGLVHSGFATYYQIQDIYNASNWADSFFFDTVRCLSFSSGLKLKPNQE